MRKLITVFVALILIGGCSSELDRCIDVNSKALNEMEQHILEFSVRARTSDYEVDGIKGFEEVEYAVFAEMPAIWEEGSRVKSADEAKNFFQRKDVIEDDEKFLVGASLADYQKWLSAYYFIFIENEKRHMIDVGLMPVTGGDFLFQEFLSDEAEIYTVPPQQITVELLSRYLVALRSGGPGAFSFIGRLEAGSRMQVISLTEEWLEQSLQSAKQALALSQCNAQGIY